MTTRRGHTRTDPRTGRKINVRPHQVATPSAAPAVDPDWSWNGTIGPIGTDADPMATPRPVTAGPVGLPGPSIYADIPDGMSSRGRTNAASHALTVARGEQVTEAKAISKPAGVTMTYPSYKPGAAAVTSMVTVDGTQVGEIAGTVENGVKMWRTRRHIDGQPVDSHRAFPTAQAALDDLTAKPDPAITGRFGHYGPHIATSYDDAMALLREHNGHVVSHRDPYGSTDGTVIDAEIWRPEADVPVMSVTITYNNDGAEVRAWWPNDTYPSASAIGELTAHRPDTTTDRAAA